MFSLVMVQVDLLKDHFIWLKNAGSPFTFRSLISLRFQCCAKNDPRGFCWTR